MPSIIEVILQRNLTEDEKVQKISEILTSDPQEANTIDTGTWQRRTPLHVATICGYAEVVRRLLATPGISKDALDGDKRGALHFAAITGDLAILELLLQAGLNVALTDSSQQTALHLAAFHRNTDVVARLLQIPGINPNPADKMGWTPLHVVNHINNTSRMSAALSAVESMTIMRLLVAAGASPDQSDRYGQTPLRHAAHHGDKEGAKYLIISGADIDRALDLATPGFREFMISIHLSKKSIEYYARILSFLQKKNAPIRQEAPNEMLALVAAYAGHRSKALNLAEEQKIALDVLKKLSTERIKPT